MVPGARGLRIHDEPQATGNRQPATEDYGTSGVAGTYMLTPYDIDENPA